ncbi:MAG: ABC-F family ATP-binding cassette domain-containing protein [Bacteroidota bacterium]
MSIISLEGIRKSFGMKPLLEDITFNIEQDEKVGIIGANGSGKTTLLKIIAGVEPADGGKRFLKKDAQVAFLSQNPVFDPQVTVLDAVFDPDNEKTRKLHDYEAACQALEKSGGTDEKLQKRVADLAHEMDITGGWDLEATARAVLSRLGINNTEAVVDTLSGGQRKRVALARALILQPDLLILDEPTNHLDAETITWLESFLVKYTGALLLVTHDRYFLERITRKMIEIERGVAHRFEGNYAYYLEKKELRAQQRSAESHKREKLIKTELAWLRRGAKARTTKQKARIDRAHDLMAQPKEKTKKEIALSSPSSRLGKKVITLKGVTKAFDGRTLIDNFSYTFTGNDRIGVIGANGTGKTTLLNLVTSRLRPDAGEIETGETVVIGYFDQENMALKDDLRLIDYVKEKAENIKLADGSFITASQMLERFLFPPNVQYTLIGSLSGGERRRLYLLRLLMGAPNVLLLDEPTNDFDLDTLIALESYLDNFAGCLIVVSHDRYFLDRTVEHLFRLEPGGNVKMYPGNYSAFLEIKAKEEEAVVNVEKKEKPKKAAPAPATKKLSYNEKRELEQLEKAIAEAEERKEVIESEIATNASNFELVGDLYSELNTLTQQLDVNIERWSELAERA